MITENVDINIRTVNIQGDEVVTQAVTSKDQSSILREKYKKFRQDKRKTITKEQ